MITRYPVPRLDKAEILREVVHVEHVRGAGTQDDPVRVVHSYWSPSGELLATRDHWKEAEAQS